MRTDLASALSRLSTLEGRQRALQGKMAKLDGQWGGDCTQMTNAIAELQRHQTLTGAQTDFVAHHGRDLEALRGQFIALAHTLDKLDKRTAHLGAPPLDAPRSPPAAR